jgi:hypothetical protein
MDLPMTLTPLYPNLNLQDLFTEPVLEADYVAPGSAGHSTDVWRVRTIRKTCIVRISAPHPLPGPFWKGCELLFGTGQIDPQTTRIWTDFIRSTGTFPTPRVYTAGEFARLNYLIVENMSGEPLKDFGELSDEGREEFGRNLAGLHMHLSGYTGARPGSSGRPPAEFPSRLSAALERLAQEFFSDQTDLTARLDEMAAAARSLAPNPFGVPIMPDIDPTQFLHQDGRITSLVDVDACAVGPREMDLIALEYILNADTAGAFVRGYESVLPIPDLKTIRPIYRFLFRLMEIQERQPMEQWLARPVLY